MTNSICSNTRKAREGLESPPRGGFLSYVVKDDKADGGRIGELAEDVRTQYEAITGETVELFFGSMSLKWGDEWRQRIDEEIENAAFFIPVITPRFFMSQECRKELRAFSERAVARGVKGIILPLYYIAVPALEGESLDPPDEMIETIDRFQRKDWRDLRFKERNSEAYRRAVADIACRLAAASREIENEAVKRTDTSPATGGQEAETSPGTIDRLATFEEALPMWTETMNGVTGDMRTIGDVLGTANEKVTNRPDSRGIFAYRQAVARQLAHELRGPVSGVQEKSRRITAYVHGVDEGLRVLLEVALLNAEELDPDARESMIGLCTAVQNLATTLASHKTTAEETLAPGLAQLEGLSRDLRPVARQLANGVQTMVEAGETTQEWAALAGRVQHELEAKRKP